MDRIVEVVAGPVARGTELAWAQLLELRHDELHRPHHGALVEDLNQI